MAALNSLTLFIKHSTCENQKNNVSSRTPFLTVISKKRFAQREKENDCADDEPLALTTEALAPSPKDGWQRIKLTDFRMIRNS